MTTMKTFGQKLTAALEGSKFNQLSLGRYLGAGKSTVHRWCNDKGLPDSSYLLKISRAVELPLEYLLDDQMDEPAPAFTGEQLDMLRSIERMGLEEAQTRLNDPRWAIVEVARALDISTSEAIKRLYSPVDPAERPARVARVVAVQDHTESDLRRRAESQSKKKPSKN